MSNAVKIYDTTLRDGTQGEGISFCNPGRERQLSLITNRFQEKAENNQRELFRKQIGVMLYLKGQR